MLRSLMLVAGEAAASLSRRRLVGLSEGTMKTQLARACDKLGATTRAEAVARYVAAKKRERT